MLHTSWVDRKPRVWERNGRCIPLSRVGCYQIEVVSAHSAFRSSFCSQTEHLIQIYTLRFVIDVLISSIKRHCHSIHMDVINVTYALIRLKTSHIRRYWMLYPPSRLGCCHPTGTPLTNPYHFFRVSIKNRNSPTQPYLFFCSN